MADSSRALDFEELTALETERMLVALNQALEVLRPQIAA